MSRSLHDIITTEIMWFVSGAEALSGGKSQRQVQLIELGPLTDATSVSSTQHSGD